MRDLRLCLPSNHRQRRFKIEADKTPGYWVVTDLSSGIERRFPTTAFVYGQMGFDEDTERYPNYIHHDLWRMAT